jgi:hypothetical protein
MNNGIFIILSITLIALTLFSIWRYLHFFNSYQQRLKEYHQDEYKKLIFKDKLVETVGEWIRWPYGSGGPARAIFNMKEYYGDKDLLQYQRKALIWLSIFLISFFLALMIFIKYNAT